MDERRDRKSRDAISGHAFFWFVFFATKKMNSRNLTKKATLTV
jgi:hypothetical protein